MDFHYKIEDGRVSAENNDYGNNSTCSYLYVSHRFFFSVGIHTAQLLGFPKEIITCTYSIKQQVNIITVSYDIHR
jgi:hypothetical protein